MDDEPAGYSLPIASLQIEAIVVEPLVLPPNAGSTLRGAFGHALRAVGCFCRTAGHGCDTTCLENVEAMEANRPTRCAYGYLFDTPRPAGSPLLERQQETPHPYVFRVEPETGRPYREGELLRFGITLLGLGITCLPAVVEACSVMLQRGLGTGRGTATIRALWEQAPFGPERVPLPPRPVAANLMLVGDWDEAVRQAETLSRERLLLEFVTPTRLIYDGVPVQRPEFAVLTRALLRRLTLLALFHGGTAPVGVFRRLAAQAAGVRLVDWHGGWHDWTRYSSRQERWMTFGGLVGTATYQGDLRPFLPYLVFGQAVQVGKVCTFGGGRYRVLTRQ